MAQYVYTMRRVGKVVPPKRVILKDISLSFFPGAKIGVLGLNGSGKSSLLRIMAGVDTSFDGEAMPMPGLRVGFLPQEPQLDASRSVRETVEEGMGEVFEAKKKLEAIYAAYAEPDADFDKLAAEQAKYEAAVELEDPFRGVVKKVAVVRDRDHGAGKFGQELLEPLDALRIEMVGGLVEQQHAGLGQQQPA